MQHGTVSSLPLKPADVKAAAKPDPGGTVAKFSPSGTCRYVLSSFCPSPSPGERSQPQKHGLGCSREQEGASLMFLTPTVDLVTKMGDLLNRSTFNAEYFNQAKVQIKCFQFFCWSRIVTECVVGKECLRALVCPGSPEL